MFASPLGCERPYIQFLRFRSPKTPDTAHPTPPALLDSPLRRLDMCPTAYAVASRVIEARTQPWLGRGVWRATLAGPAQHGTKEGRDCRRPEKPARPQCR